MKDKDDQLWARARNGDDRAREELARRNVRLVYKVARKMSRSLSSEIEFEDLVGAGAEGLIRAVDRFDPAEGNRFSTYAVPRIRGSILDALRSRDPASRTLRGRERDIHAAEATLAARLGREPTRPEVAEELGVDVERVWRWGVALEALNERSLDETIPGGDDGEGATLVEVLAERGGEVDPLENAIRLEKREELKEALMSIPDRERQILALYYFEDLSQGQIAEVLGCSEARVSQLRNGAIRKLRVFMGADE